MRTRTAAEQLCRHVLAVLHGAGLDEQGAALEAGLAAAEAPRADVDTRADTVDAAADHVAAIYLPRALSAAHAGPAAEIGAVLTELATALRWTQTAAYVAAPPDEVFLARYAHAAVLGSAAASPLLVDPTHTAAVGVLLLGPGNHYPHHRHPADEIYIPVTDAMWSSGLDEPYRPLEPGHPKHHRPGQAHAIRSGERPLLTIYLWTGDTLTSAQLC